jgi:hypothetical protein
VSDDLKTRIARAIKAKQNESAARSEAEQKRQHNHDEAIHDVCRRATRLAIDVVKPRLESAKEAIPRAKQVDVQSARENRSAAAMIFGENKRYLGAPVILYIDVVVSGENAQLQAGISHFDIDKTKRITDLAGSVENFVDSEEDRPRMIAWIDEQLVRLSPQFAEMIS